MGEYAGPGEVGLYLGEVGENAPAGLVGEYRGDVGLYWGDVGEVGERRSLPAWYCGLVGLACGEVGLY